MDLSYCGEQGALTMVGGQPFEEIHADLGDFSGVQVELQEDFLEAKELHKHPSIRLRDMEIAGLLASQGVSMV